MPLRRLPAFWVIVAAAFLLRSCIVYLGRSAWFEADTQSYFRMANHILSGTPESYFPNGFPLMIAALKLVLPDSVLPATLVGLNVLLSTSVVVMVMLITECLIENGAKGRGWVDLSGAICACYPNQLNSVREIITEVPTSFLLCLSVVLLSRTRYFSSGLAMYASALFRSTLMPVAPLMMFVMWCSTSVPRRGLLRYFAGVLVFMAVYQGIVSMEVVKPPGNLNANLLVSIANVSGDNDFSTEGFTPGEREHALRTYCTFALEHPREFAYQRAMSLWELWGFWPSYSSNWQKRVLIGLRFPLVVLAVAGLWLFRRDWRAWACFCPIAVITMVHAAFFSEPRFTAPVEPLAMVLAVASVSKMIATRGKVDGHSEET